MHDHASGVGMEAKAGIVYSRTAKGSRARTLITDTRTFAGVEDGKAFGAKLVLLAAQHGALKAKQLWFGVTAPSTCVACAAGTSPHRVRIPVIPDAESE